MIGRRWLQTEDGDPWAEDQSDQTENELRTKEHKNETNTEREQGINNKY